VTDTTMDLNCLQRVCDILNNSSPESPWFPEFEALFTAWRQSGPNLEAMWKADSGLRRTLEGNFRFQLLPTTTGRARMSFPWPVGTTPSRQESASIAQGLFVLIIINPCWSKFGGRCQRCKRYLLQKTAKLRIYCSARCSHHATAMACTTKRRQRQHQEKLMRAQQAIDRWGTGQANIAWQKRVAENDPGLTARFLTRAVNRGDLRPPERSGNATPNQS
jgi:hypothetical protein